MKKITMIFLALSVSLQVFAQGQISTKKYRLSDFTDKMTKVVLTGDEILSATIRQEVIKNWTVSVFEFCTMEQFEAIKTQDSYYFLIPVDTKFKGEEEPGITFLTLVKGGPAASEGISSMDEVISLPFAPATGIGPHDIPYLGPIVRAIQDYTLEAMDSEAVAYKKDAWFNGRLDRELRKKSFLIAREDLSSAVGEKDLEKLTANMGLFIVPADEADALFETEDGDYIVGHVIAPATKAKGSFSYQLLFEADGKRLCQISRHKISDGKGAGFLPSDLKSLGKR